MNARLLCALVGFAMVVSSTGRSAPAIIPQPETLQTRNGTFTLCPPSTPATLSRQAATPILVDGSSYASGQYLAGMLLRSTGYQFQVVTNSSTNAVRNAILLTTSNAISSLGTEGYELTVAPDSVLVRAPAQGGVFYGIQSLLQLLPPQILSLQPATNVAWTAPCVYINDQPRFSWRGYMMDESRHFFGKQEVKKFLDAMALQKMNIFHWHLVDDEGWRIQILAYPLLTQIGAWRNGQGTTNGAVTAQNNGIDFGQNPRVSSNTNSNGYYGGFYTQNDIREVVAYAATRHITVVPEIEMPCHSTAGLASYPQFGCGNAASSYCMDSCPASSPNINYGVDLYSLGTNTTIPFLQEVLTEVMGLFPGPYIHCGGDEVVSSGDTQWTTYSVDKNQMAALGISTIVGYQNWFSTNLAAFIHTNGRTMVGWSEFEAGGTVPNAILMDWEGNGVAGTTASNGQLVVSCPSANCYLDHYMSISGAGYYPTAEPYFKLGEYNSLSNVYGFEPVPTGLSSQYISNIIGSECSEFAEDIPSILNEEFKAFPRLCAMAELTWTQASLKNYTNFTARLVTHEQRLAAMGMNYDQTNAIAIGTWGPTVPSQYPTQTTVQYNITSYVTNAGSINLDFHYTSGSKAINITSVALLVNGTTVDSQTNYIGYAGDNASNLPYYTLMLRNFIPGATYTVQAAIGGYQGTSSSGTVYMVNWN